MAFITLGRVLANKVSSRSSLRLWLITSWLVSFPYLPSLWEPLPRRGCFSLERLAIQSSAQWVLFKGFTWWPQGCWVTKPRLRHSYQEGGLHLAQDHVASCSTAFWLCSHGVCGNLPTCPILSKAWHSQGPSVHSDQASNHHQAGFP